MNNDAAEKKIRLYEADRALRNDSKFRDILSYILSQKFDPSLFGSRLQKARKAARITQCNLGEGIGVTGANICKLEKGKSGNEIRKGIRVDQLCYFCDALNVTPEYLLGFTENPTEHIVSESSERSAVLEAWNAFKTEKNPENQVRAIDPIYSDAPEVAAKVKFIIHSLWSTHFLLLFNLVRLAKQPIVSYGFTCRMFAESFVGKKPLPSCSDRDELIPADNRTAAPYIQVIYQRLLRRRGMRKPKEKLSSDVQAVYVQNVFCNILMELGSVSNDLLDIFTKIASSTFDDKERINIMIGCFVSNVFGNFDDTSLTEKS